MSNDELEGLREYELLPLIRDLLPAWFGAAEVFESPDIGRGSPQRNTT